MHNRLASSELYHKHVVVIDGKLDYLLVAEVLAHIAVIYLFYVRSGSERYGGYYNCTDKKQPENTPSVILLHLISPFQN